MLDKAHSPYYQDGNSFNINGIFYKKMTNNDGMAELKINLDPGNYIITIINP